MKQHDIFTLNNTDIKCIVIDILRDELNYTKYICYTTKHNIIIVKENNNTHYIYSYRIIKENIIISEYDNKLNEKMLSLSEVHDLINAFTCGLKGEWSINKVNQDMLDNNIPKEIRDYVENIITTNIMLN